MTSRSSQILAASLLTTLVLLAWHRLATAAERPSLPRTTARLAAGDKDVKIVCFGDSVTGIYYHTGGRRAYPEMLGLALQKIYGGTAPTIINTGISGNTTRDALARIEKDVLRHQPQLVTVMFTLNDVVRVPPEQFAANLIKIIQKCRAINAEVMLCTPNGVVETPQRPISRIREYLAIIKRTGEEQHVPMADCWQAYEALRTSGDKTQGPRQFSLLMSDEIHPNMSGHKLTAETIALAISNKKISLADVRPLFPSIPKTVAALKSDRPLHVLAMPPFDKLIEPALKLENPRVQVQVTPWPTSGKTLATLEEEAKKVRKMKVDLVLIAVPSSATATTEQEYQRLYTWVLNSSLSFGRQEWDCVAFPATLFESNLSSEDQARDLLARQLILAQDLDSIERKPGNTKTMNELFANWLHEQLQPN